MSRLLITIRFLCASLFLASVPIIHAHEPFDLSSQIVVSNTGIELTTTAGVDAATQVLANGGVSPDDVKKSLRAVAADMFVEHPLTVAEHLVKLYHANSQLTPQKVTTRSEGLEIYFTVSYARPPAGGLSIQAVCYQTIPDLRTGVMVVTSDSGTALGAALLSRTNFRLDVALPPEASGTDAEKAGLQTVPDVQDAPAGVAVTPEVATGATPQPGFSAFFWLGVEHILIGIDHLLFLGALLIGVRQLRTMVKVVTCFTVGHSVTLALAAAEILVISPRVIEPLIALSIMIVCVANFIRREAEHDRPWLAGGFGLIHGFGFASVLQASGLAHSGSQILVPLFSFNLGVEVGQLAVAAIFLPVLFLMRKWKGWPRYGFPMVSAALIIVSAYWCFERVFSV